MLATIALNLLSLQPQPLALDHLGLDRTRTLDGMVAGTLRVIEHPGRRIGQELLLR